MKLLIKSAAIVLLLSLPKSSPAQSTGDTLNATFFKTLRNKKMPADSLLLIGRKLQHQSNTLHVIRGKILTGLGYLYHNQLDSSSQILFDALDQAEGFNPLSFEVGLAHNYLGSLFTRLNNHPRASSEFQTAIEIFRSVGSIEYLAASISNLGTAYGAKGDYPKALEYFLEAQKLTSHKEVSADQRANILGNLSTVYTMMKKHREALPYAFQALKIDQNEKNIIRTCQAYNTIGNIYNNMNDYDSALYYYQLTLNSVTAEPEFKSIAERALQNMSRTYIRQGKMQDAIRVIRQAQRSNIKLQSEVLYNRLSSYHLVLKQYDSAIYFSRKALLLGKFANSKNAILDAYRDLQTAFKGKKLFDSAYTYLNLENIYKDSIYNESSLEKFSNLRIELETLGKERELAFAKQEAELSKAKSSLFRSIIISGFLIGLLLFASLVLFYQYRQKKQQLKTFQLEEELRKRSHDLRQQALKMIYINHGLVEVEDRLKRMKQESSSDEVNKVLKTLHVNRSLEKEWDNFNSYFGHLHIGFFEKLDEAYPTLTITDKRLAGLVRMNLTNREIASLLNIEDNSVKMAKHRLKKKLGLGDEQQLYTFLVNLVPTSASLKAEKVVDET
jgi:tetratricopeptide (TPR) repeat protein